MKVSPELERRILELSGEAPAKPARRPATAARPVVQLRLWLPGLLPRSEANMGGKRRAAIARKTAVKDAVRAALDGLPVLNFRLPTPVVLTRVGGKKMDSDNLARCFKAARDVIAKEYLNCDDGDTAAVSFSYKQRAGYESGTEILVG